MSSHSSKVWRRRLARQKALLSYDDFKADYLLIHGPFTYRAITEADPVSWQGYKCALQTKTGVDLDIFKDESFVRDLVEHLNTRLATLIMVKP